MISNRTSILLPVFVTTLFLLLTTACEKNLKLAEIPASKKIVLLGELVAGDTVLIRGGQSSPISDYSDLPDLPEPMQVSIQASGGIQNLNSFPDYNVEFLRTIPYSLPQTVLAGEEYKLTASHLKLGTATATVTIPQAFNSNVVDTASTSFAGLDVWQAVVQIENPNPGDRFYAVEALKQIMLINGTFFYDNNFYDINYDRPLYDSLKNAGVPLTVDLDTGYMEGYSRIQLYTNDLNTENLKFGTSVSGFNRILLDGRDLPNSSYDLKVFLDKEQLTGDTDWSKGRVIIRVKSVSEDYFRYLTRYEQKSGTFSFLGSGQPVNAVGNVENGLGVIGGVFQRQFFFFFDNWEL